MDNSQRLNELFNQARNQAPKTSFKQTKSSFTTAIKGSSTSTLLSKIKSFKTLLIMTLSAIILGIGLTYFNTTTPTVKYENVAKNVPLAIEEKTSIISLENIEKIEPKTVAIITPKKTTKQAINVKQVGLNLQEISKTYEVQELSEKVKKVKEDIYRFPELTIDQIEDNHKQKKRILKDLSKFDKKKYVFIPSGETTIKGDKVSVNAFYMQTTEVSVLEYRTFLYDLLIQDRKDDFLIAKPDQKQWSKYGEYTKPMEVNYFSHPAYDDYPVNNISKAGVELYCKWLNEEQTKLYGKAINAIRLPTSEEWMYAAKGGIAEKSPYPWGGPYIRNSKGFYLANFYPMKDKHNDDGEELTAKVDSYNPNYFGLYCMSGNVAEMVIDNNGKIVAKGGGWNSIGEQLQIEADNDFENAGEPNPEIGFRVVISYTNKKGK